MSKINFTSQIVKNCKDIRAELENFSKTHKIDSQLVWFEILNIQTLIKEYDTFKLMPQENLDDEDFYNQDYFQIIQQYDIRIIPKEQDIHITLKLSPFANVASLFLHEHCLVSDTEVFFKALFGRVETLLAYEGVIIRRRQELQEIIKEHIARIMDKELSLPCEFVLQQAKRYHPQQEAFFDFLPKKEWEEENKAVENAYFAVNKGDIVVLFHKSQESKSGRNLFGQYVVPTKLNLLENTTLPKFNPQEIEMIEEEEKILFISLLNAYASIRDGEIVFYAQNEFHHIDILSTPPLLGGTTKDIVLNISSLDPQKDAINSGVILEASKINVVGNIGSNVKLRAMEIVIEGQTHQSTEIVATKANISIHKGNLIAQDVCIKSLESGFVQADVLDIENCTGGQILSRDAKIARVTHNNTITISHRLYLGNIDGNNNVIMLSSLAYSKTKELIDSLVKKKDFLIHNAKKIYTRYSKILSAFKKNKMVIAQVNAADETLRQQMMQHKDIVQIYQKQNHAIKELRQLKQELLDYQHFVKNTMNSLVQIDEEILNAQIFCDDSWGENTQLVYQREYPKKELKSINVAKDHKGGYRIDKETREFVSI